MSKTEAGNPAAGAGRGCRIYHVEAQFSGITFGILAIPQTEGGHL